MPALSTDEVVVRRILIVDDNEHVRQIAAFALRRLGYDIHHAADGLEALAKLRTERPAVAIIDIHMPDMDGLDVVRAMTKDPDLASIPVIMLTASGDEHAVRAAVAAGVRDYILKPFTSAQLAERVEAVLTRS